MEKKRNIAKYSSLTANYNRIIWFKCDFSLIYLRLFGDGDLQIYTNGLHRSSAIVEIFELFRGKTEILVDFLRTRSIKLFCESKWTKLFHPFTEIFDEQKAMSKMLFKFIHSQGEYNKLIDEMLMHWKNTMSTVRRLLTDWRDSSLRVNNWRFI